MTKLPAKPIAVHLHLYYTDMWSELRAQLQNLGNTPYDLFVTLVADNSKLIAEIKKFHPQTEIWLVKNMGYDIGPFMVFLNRINLNNYSYILKLHSKRPSNGLGIKNNGYPISRYYWKVLLSEALIGSPEIWQRNLQALSEQPELGMIASPYLIKKSDKCDEKLTPTVIANLQQLNLPPLQKYSFVAGTMFIVRAELFKPLQHQYTLTDFQITDGKISDGTFAHVMERLFGAVIEAQGFAIKGFATNRRFLCHAVGQNILTFFYQKKITKNNKLLIKICKIPVFQKKLS